MYNAQRKRKEKKKNSANTNIVLYNSFTTRLVWKTRGEVTDSLVAVVTVHNKFKGRVKGHV